MPPDGHRSIEILMDLLDLTYSVRINRQLNLFVPGLIVPSQAWGPLAILVETFLANKLRVARLNNK